MADVARTLAGLRLPVRSARVWTLPGTATTQHAVALSEWEVDEEHVEKAVVVQQLEAALSGFGHAASKSRRAFVVDGSLPPSVLVHHEASSEATVLEVRTQDTSGVLHVVCRALAELDLSVRSAHVTTVGPQALDVFYVQEAGAGALSDARAAEAVHAVRSALEHAATLD
jgi:[protein-PII] uridylyltransferase